MTQFHSPKPPDFDPLRAFLQANIPQAPEPKADLEIQLMQTIESLPQESKTQGVTIPRKVSKRWWILAVAIVTSAGLVWGGRSWQMAKRSIPTVGISTVGNEAGNQGGDEAELLALQTFLEDTWGVVGYVDTTKTTDTWSNTAWIVLGQTDLL